MSDKRNVALLLSFLALGESVMFCQQALYSPRRDQVKQLVSIKAHALIFVDTRQLALRQYFQACSCPAVRWTQIFIQEADRNGLDWRLVASIAMIESSGGKHYRNRNILGWHSAGRSFRSEPAGIEYVSARLHRSPLYARKPLIPLLRTYNPGRRNYADLVTGVMRELAALEDNLKKQQNSLASRKAVSLLPWIQ